MRSTALFLCLCVVVAMVTTSEAEHPDHPPEQTHSKSTNVASQYLLSNWRVFFHAIDVNHDNVLNKKDFADNRERYIYLATQRGELDHSLLEKLDRWWTDYVFKGDLNLQMTEKQYVDFMNSMYVADKEAFEAFGKETIIKVWEFLNLNSDKYISWEEFGVAETVFGHPTYARDYAGYLAFKPVLVAPLSRFIEAWTDVAIDDDEAGPRIVKDTFMKDGFE